MNFTDRQKALIVRMVRIGSRPEIIAMSVYSTEKQILKFIADCPDCQAAMQIRNKKPEPMRNRPNDDYTIDLDDKRIKDPRPSVRMYRHEIISKVLKKPDAPRKIDYAAPRRRKPPAVKPATAKDVFRLIGMDKQRFPNAHRVKRDIKATGSMRKGAVDIILEVCSERIDCVLNVFSSGRMRETTMHRAEIAYKMKERFPNASLNQIASVVGARDHTIVRNQIMVWEKILEQRSNNGT